MIYSVFDLEADGLIEGVTKIHCLCYRKFDNGVLIKEGKLINYKDMIDFLLGEHILIGHKIVTYDIPVIEKILNIKVTARLIDTLGVSWYLYPERLVHGLDEWGYEFGIQKPPINDWHNLPVEDYVFRCSEDVRINVKLWDEELIYLKKIYNDNNALDRFLRYISFKLDCAREQEEVKWKLDKDKCESNLKILSGLYDEKIVKLSAIMPKHITYKKKDRPKVMLKKDGSVSKLGEDWFKLLKEMGLPEYHNGTLKLVDKIEPGNPGSHPQLKEWLFSLGWIPTTFKYVKDKNTPYSKDTPPRKVPQLQSDDNDEGLCDSVKALFEKEPRLEELDSLFLIRSRISTLKGFLESIDSDNFLKAEINGLTNTLRMQHRKPIANLAGIPKKYWEMVRECLITRDEDHILCGSDMSGLEDSTKRHYMYFYDPIYVKEMMQEGFDPHLDIAVRAGLLTKEEVTFYKELNKETTSPENWEKYKKIKGVRLKAKKTNFAAVYGAGGPKIAITANVPLEEGNLFHKTYWDRNKAVKEVANNSIVRIIFRNGVIKEFLGEDVLKLKGDTLMKFMGKVQSIWLYNPVSQFYYSLRYFKDIFSTLNQGTGVYCFDMWTKYCREQGYKICMQYHDEHVGDILKTEQEKTKQILTNAINKVNEVLKLNIKLGISTEFGNNYAAIH